jgi:glucosamine-6-phosphate deaminase
MQSFSFEKVPTRVYNTQDAACNAVANDIAALIKMHNSQNKKTILGLATGITPKKVYKELIRQHKEEGLSFKNVIAFNLDEYYPLPENTYHSYKHFMDENLFNHIDIDKSNCHIPNSGVE